MSIYTKPVSQLTTTDLQELLNDGAAENLRLEFKREVPDKQETLKKVSSFANTFGGLIVVGASARSSDGRIEALSGVAEQSGYRQKVVDWCFNGANPPLTVSVSDPLQIPTANGKVCYVISVPESDLAPHFLNGRKGIWIRTDEFSGRFDTQLANESEVRQLFDRRAAIVQRRTDLLARARERYRTYASNVQETKKVQPGATFEFSLVPRFPAVPVCEQQTLSNLITTTRLNWRQVGFPGINNNVISQHESAIVIQPARPVSMIEANVWGMLFYGAQIEAEQYLGDQHKGYAIHLHEFAGLVLIFIAHAAEMLKSLGYTGPLLLQTGLTDFRKAQWLYSSEGGPWMEVKAASGLDDQVLFSIESSTDDFQERPDGVAMDLLRYVFFSVDWPQLTTSKQLEAVVRSGYKFNYWEQPTALRV